MNPVEKALYQFKSDEIYLTIPIPERQRLEEAITQLFSRTHCKDSIQVFRYTSTQIQENHLTVISFGNEPIVVRKVAAEPRYWSIKNKVNGKALKILLSTEAVVIDWSNPMRAKVASFEYGGSHVDHADFYWEAGEEETFVEKEHQLERNKKDYSLSSDKKWNYSGLIDQLEDAELVKLDSDESIIEINELKGEFEICMDELKHSPKRSMQYIREHLQYLYNTKVLKKNDSN